MSVRRRLAALVLGVGLTACTPQGWTQYLRAYTEIEPTRTTPDQAREIGLMMLRDWITADHPELDVEAEWECLDPLWTRESGWRTSARNPSSGAGGIPQAYPASKMRSHGYDWATNAATQIGWGLDYIFDRYGSPCGALGFWDVQDARTRRTLDGWY